MKTTPKTTYLVFILILFCLTNCQQRENNLLIILERDTELEMNVLHLIDVKEGATMQITKFGLRDSYHLSPSSQKIAVFDSANNLKILSTLNGEQLGLVENIQDVKTAVTGTKYNALSWSEDEQKVAFMFDGSQADNSENLTTDFDIGIYNLLTDEITYIDNNQASMLASPTWSNSNNDLVFARVFGCENIHICLKDDQQWEVVKFDTQNQEQTILLQFHDTGICNFTWSPDNRFLIFESECNSGAVPCFNEIYSITIETSQLNQITDSSNCHDLYYYSVHWQDNNKFVLGFTNFIEEQGGFSLIDMSNLNTNMLLTTENFNHADYVVWSPNSNYVIGANISNGSYVAEYIDSEVKIRESDLPEVSLNGCWNESDNTFVTMSGKKLVSIDLSNGDIFALDIELPKNVFLVGSITQ